MCALILKWKWNGVEKSKDTVWQGTVRIERLVAILTLKKIVLNAAEDSASVIRNWEGDGCTVQTSRAKCSL